MKKILNENDLKAQTEWLDDKVGTLPEMKDKGNHRETKERD